MSEAIADPSSAYFGWALLLGAGATFVTAVSRLRKKPVSADNKREIAILTEDNEEMKNSLREAVGILGDVRDMTARGDERIKAIERQHELLRRDFEALLTRVNRRFDGSGSGKSRVEY